MLPGSTLGSESVESLLVEQGVQCIQHLGQRALVSQEALARQVDGSSDCPGLARIEELFEGTEIDLGAAEDDLVATSCVDLYISRAA